MPAEAVYLRLLLLSSLLIGAFYGWLLHRRKQRLSVVIGAPVMALLGGLAGARLFYFAVRSGFLVPMYGWGALFSLPYNGLAMGGAILGCLLALWLVARALKIPAFSLLDPAVMAGCLFAGVARMLEYGISFGQGAYVENPAHQFFPLAVMNEWEEWYYAVFALEALIAFLCFLYALKMRKAPAGRPFKLVLSFLMLGQILAESLRAESLKWGFVRVHQLFAVLLVAAVLISFLIRAKGRAWWLLPLYLLCVAVLIGIEFGLDKWEEAPNWALYLGMSAVLTLMGGMVYRLEQRTALSKA